MDDELDGYETDNLVKLDILINGSPVDAFSSIVYRQRLSFRAVITSKLKELIPRQQYEVAIQAAIGSKVIARTTVKPTAKMSPKCYEEISHGKSCWKAEEGKKRMKQIGMLKCLRLFWLSSAG